MAQQESMFPFPASVALPEPRLPQEEDEGQLFNDKQAEHPQHHQQQSYPNPMSPLSPTDSVVRASPASPARKTRKFTCVRLLGKGGFAEVYLARDNETLLFVILFPTLLIFVSLRFRSNFAMKACQPKHQDILDNEIFVLRRLQSHCNIVKYINAYVIVQCCSL
jgi:hypothetical protein